jgi:diketogulonate reductase-like aldo/keto reductase
MHGKTTLLWMTQIGALPYADYPNGYADSGRDASAAVDRFERAGMNHDLSARRTFLRQAGTLLAGAAARAPLSLAGAVGALLASVAHGAADSDPDIGINTDSGPLNAPIPGADETLPKIGMGTYITFNVGADTGARRRLAEVLRTFFALGGGMIDSSPMYGTAEAVLGDLLAERDDTEGLFSATKVWTRSTSQGEEQIDASLDLWGIPGFDLIQVHNLVNWREHLATMRARRDAGEIRYIGITSSHGRRHDELERIMRDESIDFVQLTYNIVDREVEDRLLPLARDLGIAVIANRPFRRGRLFDRFADHPLPNWAGDYAIDNWAQFFLKFIVSHEAVTCAIPATSQPRHMAENMGAMYGPLPDADARRAMIEYVESL